MTSRPAAVAARDNEAPPTLSMSHTADLYPEQHTVPDTLLVLAGNPNVGKSVIFNALSGRYANVSNFPGTTVDIPKGNLPDGTPVWDTPGVYGLSGLSEEEQVAENTLKKATHIINVVSAATLSRDLFLTQQLLDWGRPLLVVVNQLDEAEAAGIHVDLDTLSKLLGVPVVGTVATKGTGIDGILAHWQEARPGYATPDSPPPEELANLEAGAGQRMAVYGLRRHHVNQIVPQVIQKKTDAHAPWTHRTAMALGKLLLNPVVGLVSGMLVLMALYQVIGIWVAGDLVDFTEGTLMLGYVVPWLKSITSLIAPEGSWPFTLLAGEFGVLTMSVQYIFGVLFPLVLGFYVYISLLEDCGYLPRIAVLADGLLNRIGLNGRAVIPLILGLGCVTMATVSTRVLTSQRERTIASTLLAITIPCSAQLGVIMGLMALHGGLGGWALYMAVLFTVLLSLGTVLHKLLPGRSTSLVLDLPPMRMPNPKNVVIKTWVRTKAFLFEAAPLFMLGSLLVGLAQVTGLLAQIQVWLAPVTVWLLQLPAESAQAFVMGMVRRDFGAAGLYFLAENMTALQVLTALVVITLFVPCIASATVMWKERGWKESAIVLLGSWVLAFVIGAIVTRSLGWIPGLA